MPQKVPDVALSGPELELVKRVAVRDGISEEEAATLLVKGAIARRVKRRTGKNPARVYSMRKRGGK